MSDPTSQEQLRRQVLSRATAALGTAEKAQHWLDSPNRAFGGIAPASLLASSDGTQQVMQVLTRIEHGVMS